MEPVTKQNLVDFVKEVKDRSEKRHCELKELQARANVLTLELNYLEDVLNRIAPLTEPLEKCETDVL